MNVVSQLVWYCPAYDQKNNWLSINMSQIPKDFMLQGDNSNDSTNDCEYIALSVRLHQKTKEQTVSLEDVAVNKEALLSSWNSPRSILILIQSVVMTLKDTK